ncbi:Zinc finger BED domain containing protein [Gracilaria domingensis]|nr:Zinc finger BED domain containing protein [Gracilaria domingensis]
MNPAIERQVSLKSAIVSDLPNVKTVARIFKQENWNGSLPTRFALIQEIKTRFGTTMRVDSEAAKASFDGLTTETNGEGNVVYPALEAIVSAFRPVFHAQKKLEAHKKPTMHLILPILEQLESQVRQIGGVVLSFLSQIEVHSLWTAGSPLHPRMRLLGFVKDSSKRNAYKSKGSVLVKRLLRNYVETDKAKDVEALTFNDSVAPKDLGAQSFCLYDMFDIVEGNDGDVDAYEKYMIRKFPLSTLKQLKSIGSEDDHGTNPIKFWLSQETVCPELTKVALCIYAIPVSSSSSERNFSAVNRMITADRSRLESNIVEDMMYLRSM